MNEANEDVGQKYPNEVVKNIIDNYKSIEESIVSQLGLYYGYSQLNTGINREDIWLKLFQMIIPKKFVIEHSIFIIDSMKRISREVDLAIIDNTYTPYIFKYETLKFVPIEAVAAVVECKSSRVSFSNDSKDDNAKATLDRWCDSIKQLRTSRNSIVRMAAGISIDGKLTNSSNSMMPTQTSTRPIRIFCGYKTEASIERLKELFDFVLIAKEDKIHVHWAIDNLQEWYLQLNHYEMNREKEAINECIDLSKYTLSDLKITNAGEECSILSFNFQINQLLMLINNPIMFPHQAYAEIFCENEEE